jgi:hypothetical protein
MVHARSAFLCCGGEKSRFVAAHPVFETRTSQASSASTRQWPIVQRRSGGGIVMYLMVVVLLMGVLPVVSIIAEGALSHGGADLALLIGKWFVFWSVGVRLILAGLRQIANPSFTAESIFGVRDKGALTIVRELGCGNLSHRAARALRSLQSGVDHARGGRGRSLLRAGWRPAPHERGSKLERDHRDGLGSLHLSRARRLSRRSALPSRMSIAGDRGDRSSAS